MVATVPPVWLYWMLHIMAWLLGIVTPIIIFFIAKGKDKPPRNAYAESYPQDGDLNNPYEQKQAQQGQGRNAPMGQYNAGQSY